MNTEPMAVVVGRNAKSIRQKAGATLANVAKVAKFYGLPWTTGRVGAFESGNVSPTLTTLLAVCDTLGTVTKTPVALVDLFAGEGRIEITPKLNLELDVVRRALSGSAVQSTVSDRPGGREELMSTAMRGAREITDAISGLSYEPMGSEVLAAFKLERDFADADFKVAKSLGVDQVVAALAMNRLWNHTYVTERDRRAGPDANAQRKGRIARDLKYELRDWIDGNSS